MNDETFMTKGEIHYVWPHDIVDGYSVRCGECRYFTEDEKNRSGFIYIVSGECHSEARRADRSYTTVGKGRMKKLSNSFCRWWFPKEKQAGEQESIYSFVFEENSADEQKEGTIEPPYVCADDGQSDGGS